ncbi:hypothetical protein PG995_004099 [Apiospora arundinis]
MAHVQLLAAFGQADWFRAAFNWDRDQIFQWMERASLGEVGGDSTKKELIQRYLKTTLSKIRDLSLPNGRRYHDPNVLPDSHFLRTFNTAWDPIKDPVNYQTLSKFHLQESRNEFRRGARNRGIQVPYWNPHDLLGYFLSLLGPAPRAATKSNFFLPLTAVYARWCAKIAGRAPPAFGYPPDPNPGAGNWPFMYQCTWRDDPSNHDTDEESKKWFFLGASLGGDAWTPQQVGQFKTTVGQHRFQLLLTCAQTKLVNANAFEKRQSPEQLLGGGNQTAFGSCAEGYPFVEMMSGDRNKNRTLYGLALAREFMADPNLNAYDGRRNGVVWGNLKGPCRNCSKLIQKANGLVQNFAIDLGIQEAPEN